MDTIKSLFFLAVVAAVSFFPCKKALAQNPRDILIIVNKSVRQDSITLSEAKNFFLKEKITWRSGDQVVPIHAYSGSSIRKAFVERVLGIHVEDEKIFWRERKIKTGKFSPVEFANTLKAVFKLQGSIGYVYRSQYIEGVAKVILVLPAQGEK